MISFKHGFQFQHPALVTAFCGLLISQGLLAQPSQDPLLNRDGGGVPPNIMMTLDDSGSMMFQHMPEVTIFINAWDNSKTKAQNNAAGAYSMASPIGGGSVRFDPSDTQTLGGPGSANGNDNQFSGTIAAQQGSTNVLQKLMRSPDTNSIYYNPDVRYLPWALKTYPLPAATSTNPLGRMANASVTAALINPMNAGDGSVNLTRKRDVTDWWCFRDSRTDCPDYPDGTKAKESYDPGLFYRLKKTTGGLYMDPSVAANYIEYSINPNTFGAAYPTKAATRVDCAGSVCTQTEERKNFANWFTYYRTRNMLARGSVAEAFKESPNTFRLGWGRINQGSDFSVDGVNTKVVQQGVRDYTQTTKNAFFDWLYALPANGGTPLPRAMDSVGKYFSRNDNKGPWTDTPGTATSASHKSCRRNYQIMVTDGYWNDTTTAVGNADGTNGLDITGPGRTYKYIATRPYSDGNENTLADYSIKYWKNDLRTDSVNNVIPSAENPAFWQHLTNFTVGLGVRGLLQPPDPNNPTGKPGDLPALISGSKAWSTDRIDDLWHAALNSRGDSLSAKDPTELAEAITTSLGAALKRELREAGVATASTVLQDGNRKYVPLYKTGDWTGDIQAFVLDAAGQAGVKVWTAESKLPPAASRNIWTWNTNTNAASQFTWATIGAANQTALGTGANAALVDYLRGDRSNEGDGKPYRARLGVLGDFINSNPVLVKDSVNMGYSALTKPGGGSPYTAFLTAKAARHAVLYVGGNDGMLHGFKDTLNVTASEDGKEVFAYVPSVAYPELMKLSDKTYGLASGGLTHRFYVDGPLSESDAYVGGAWRNYLLGSTGAGGRSVFALDVTNPASLNGSTIAWEITSASNGDLGYVSSPVQVGVLDNGEWVALFGNGRFSNAGKAVLFVVNLNTKAVQTLDVETTLGSNGLGGVGVLRNTEGVITNLYVGDLKGNLWKLNYKASAASRFEVDGGKAMFQATPASGATVQQIMEPPLVYPFPATSVITSSGSTCTSVSEGGGHLILFGSGVLNTKADANSKDVQAMYAVWDKPGDTIPRPMGRGYNSTTLANTLEPRTISAYSGADVSGGVFYGSNGSRVNWTKQRGWVIDLSVTGIEGLRVVYPPQRVNSKTALFSTVAPARDVVVCEAASGSGINFLLGIAEGGDVGLPPVSTDPAIADPRGSGFDPTTDKNSDGKIDLLDRTLDAKYDLNGDGKITAADCGAFDPRYDANNDGQIDSLDRVSKSSFDTDGDGVIDARDRAVAGYGTGADGIDAVVFGTKVCLAGVCNQDVSFQNTTAQMRANVAEDDPGSLPPPPPPPLCGTSGAPPCPKCGDPGEPPCPPKAVKDRIWSRVINPPIR